MASDDIYFIAQTLYRAECKWQKKAGDNKYSFRTFMALTLSHSDYM
jgi:hypothetical protein